MRIAGVTWRYIFNICRQDKGVFYLYSIGGSTAEGAPYNPKISPPKIISYILKGKANDREIKLVNLAECGKDLEYGYWRLYQELFRRPHKNGILLIYSGINEGIIDSYDDPNFAYYKVVNQSILLSKLLFLLKDPRFDYFSNALNNSGLLRNSLKKYEYRLEKTVRLAKSYGLNVIVSTVASNISGFPTPCYNYRDKQERKVYLLAKIFKGKKDAERLRLIYKGLLKKSAFASPILCYRLAECYKDLGLYDKAREYYWRAADNRNQRKASRKQNELIKEVAMRNGIGLTDTVKYFEDASLHRLMGYNLFFDAHHPKLEGYLIMARGFVEEMKNMIKVSPDYDFTGEDIIKHFDYTEEDYFGLYFETVIWFCIAAIQDDTFEILDKTGFYFKEMERINLHPNEVYFAHFAVSTLRKDKDEAMYWLGKGKFLSENRCFFERFSWTRDHRDYFEDFLKVKIFREN